jgi:hypothetical protein
MIRILSEIPCGQRGQCGQALQTDAISLVLLSTSPVDLCPHGKTCGQQIVKTVDSIRIDISMIYDLCPHRTRCPHQKTGACQTHVNDSNCFMGGVQWDYGNRSNRVG